MSKARICHIDRSVQTEWCTECVARLETLPSASEMTPLERATELWQWMGPLQIPFSDLHKRIEELAGRSVWTHELAHPWQIAVEILGGEPIGFDEVVRKLTDYNKPVIVVPA